MPKSDRSDGDAFAGIRFEHNNCQRAQDACGMTDCGQCGAAGNRAKLEKATTKPVGSQTAIEREFDQECDDPRLISNNGLAAIVRT